MNNNIENVLEVEIKKIDDNYSYARIIYQNYDILKRGEFGDDDIGAYSRDYFEIAGKYGILCINGIDISRDNMPIIIENKLVSIIKEKVDEINNKYGIRKRWRAKNGRFYYFIDTIGNIVSDIDSGYVLDNKKFEIGNYFKTKEDAMNSKLYKAFKGLRENEEK